MEWPKLINGISHKLMSPASGMRLLFFRFDRESTMATNRLENEPGNVVEG